MFKVGEKYKMLKAGAMEQKDVKWVNAEVEYIPKHQFFIQFRFHFVNMFGEHTSYTESFSPNELRSMKKTGVLVKR